MPGLRLDLAAEAPKRFVVRVEVIISRDGHANKRTRAPWQVTPRRGDRAPSRLDSPPRKTWNEALMTLGVWSGARWLPAANFGYPRGRHGQNRPLFFVDHIMAGWKRTMDDQAWLDASGISAHFGIGLDGSVSQYVNILDAAYGNGLVGSAGRGDATGRLRYDRRNRHLAALEREPGASWVEVQTSAEPPRWGWTLVLGGVNAWNSHSIAVEHEGVDPSAPWPDAMVEADIAVKRWCNEELARAGVPPVAIDEDALVAHGQIDAVNRPNCPGSGRPKTTILRALAEEDDVYHQHDASAAFLTNKTIAGPQRVNARYDFALPPPARRVRIELFLTRGYLRVLHGDTRAVAGRAGWGIDVGKPGYGCVDVCLDADGWLELIGGDELPGGSYANPAVLQTAHAVAYWT
jgi:hypothetical protein